MSSVATPPSIGSSYSKASPFETRSSRPVCLERLYDTVRSYLLACSEREPLLTQEDVRDLTSEVVSSVWTKRAELRNPHRYARRASRNRLTRFLVLKRRRLRTRQEWLQEKQSSSAYRESDSTAMHAFPVVRNRTRMDFMRQSLACANGEVRLILHLRHDAGMSWADIAEIAGVTPSAARMKALRFRKRVRLAWERADAGV